VAVATARLLTLPRSLWEGDEVLFVKGVELFDPLHHQPHPPGYPLLIGLGKLLDVLVQDPFASLVTLSVISSLVGYFALADAFRRIAPAGTSGASEADRVAIAGATLFHLSPAMLVYGPLALSDPPALMFLSLALCAAARLRESGALRPAGALGAAAAAAVGCRPQLAVAVLPMLAVALWPAGSPRNLRPVAAGLSAFTAVALLWFIPLVLAVGGPAGLLPFLGKQAGLVARYDAGAVRAGGRAYQLWVGFLAHPWGTRWTSVPLLGLAAAGTVALAASRRIGTLPLAVLCGVDLAFALVVMNPSDAVRYALPSLVGVAFAAAVGGEALARRARLPGALWPALGLFAAGFVVYTGPLLAARTTAESPPVQAARWIARSVPRQAVLLIDKELAAHASYLLRDFVRVPADPGLEVARKWRPGTPVFLFGEAESRWPGARMFRWQDSDAYGNLTRGKFRVVSVSPIPAERRYGVVRGAGAFEPGICQPIWRWLGPDAAIRLGASGSRRAPGAPGRPGGTVAVTLGLPEYAPLRSVPVTVAVDGTAGRVVDVPRGGQRTIVLPLPALPADAQANEVTFRAPTSFVPAELGMGRGRRRLAGQLLGVERHLLEER
jgi:hypothetical protein